ncbi:hypothetical protein V6N13_025653 [Hibiscus sabdariffa]|uniref:PB1 domain-containing protein n=2 Tax=Hibiscus sabdariffa TaxID=183260 RepID=A0ABR1ZNA0_9ROSI
MFRRLTIKPPSQSQASTPKQETVPPMDPPPLPAVAATSVHLNYPDSIESSPRSHNDNTYDDLLPAVPGARLRLMCSFGGHIIPRPHDKSLCYVGGETRIVAVDRHCSLSALCTRLSRALLNGRSFTLKYQLPNEDLDSLVSVATDEDLENMIEEYDRLTAPSVLSTPSRIRLFLFFDKPDTAASMGPLLNDAKSETWFVDALNGSGLVPRGDSDTATIQTLLNLDGEFEADEGAEEPNKQIKHINAVQEVQCSLHDSPMAEKTSSFGSSSSSPSMSNLPPIRVRMDHDGHGGPKVQEQRLGIDEQFARIGFATNSNIHKQDDCYGAAAVPSLPPQPVSVAAPRAGGSSDNLNRILSDDERSDQGVPVSFRRPPLPLQPVQQKASGTYNLPSPDSVASDSSISSFSKPMYHQDQIHVAAASLNTNADSSIPSSQIQIPQIQDSYSFSSQLDQHQHHPQQQFVQDNIRYVPHQTAPATPMPMSSFYPVYAPPLQQQLHHPADQQYPAVYVMQPQPYMSMQSNTGVVSMKSNASDASIMAPSRPLATPSPSVASVSAAYKETVPPIYPTSTASLAKPEMTATMYRTAVPPTHQVVQVQQPYVGFSQMQHPPQSPAVTHTTNYIYEYPNPTQDQMYYAQQQVPQLPPQYQTLTPAAAAAALADASKQLPTDSSNQQIRISQPL